MSRSRPRQPSRELPRDEAVERAVLACVLLAAEKLDEIAPVLTGEDFYLERHQRIFAAMLGLAEAQEPIDLRTLERVLTDGGHFEQIGGFAYLASLDTDLPNLDRAAHYAGIVKDLAIRRQLIARLGQVVDGCYRGTSSRDALAAAERLVLALGGQVTRSDFTDLETTHQETFDVLSERAAGGLIGIPSGFPALDHTTGGLCPGTLIVVAGRPGMGKTSFMLDVARHVAFREGRVVGVLTLEMGRVELNQRVIAAETNLDHARIRRGQLTRAQWEQVADFMQRTAHQGLYFDETPDPTLAEITAKARRLRARVGRLDLLCLDYLQLMTTDQPRFRREMLEQITRGLKRLARDLEIPVILLSQLNRGPESRAGDHRPRISDLRETGAIEQDADLILFPFREEIYDPGDVLKQGQAELIVAKHRNGELGKVGLYFHAEQSSFRSLAEGPEGDSW